MQDIKLNSVEEGIMLLFHTLLNIYIKVHTLVFFKYTPSWNFLKDNISVEEAKKALSPFFMGRHLAHAPQEYLEKIVFADILKLWKEESRAEIPYIQQGLRGMKMNCFVG